MNVVGRKIKNDFSLMMSEVKNKNYDRMDTMHHLLAGFKSIFSDTLCDGIDKCRRACGGAGYASMSGFTELASVSSPVPTYEGDNIVMLLQASRYVLKLFKKAQKGEKLQYPFTYISNIPGLLSLKDKGKTEESLMSLKTLEQALAVRAGKLI